MKCRRFKWKKLLYTLLQAVSDYLYTDHVVTWMLLGTLCPLCKTSFQSGNTVRTLLTNCDDWFISFQRKEDKYRITNIFTITRASTVVYSRYKVRREMTPCFGRQTISCSSGESSRKYKNAAMKITKAKQSSSLC